MSCKWVLPVSNMTPVQLLLLQTALLSGQDKYLGCYQEPTLNFYPRLFNDGYMESASLKRETCVSFCTKLGAQYIGLENGVQCFCSKKRPDFINTAEEAECNTNCSGDATQICGGVNRLTVHHLDFLGGDFVSVFKKGCYADLPEDNMLPRMAKKYPGLLTPERCMGHCWRGGYQLAAITGDECRCGDHLLDERKMPEGECSTVCAGDLSIKCGGPARISVYSTGIKDTWGAGRDMGCFQDTDNILPSPEYTLTETNTPRRCANVCLFLGFQFSGVENTTECYCGDVAPTANPVQVSECQSACPGERTESCGGESTIQVYRTT